MDLYEILLVPSSSYENVVIYLVSNHRSMQLLYHIPRYIMHGILSSKITGFYLVYNLVKKQVCSHLRTQNLGRQG